MRALPIPAVLLLALLATAEDKARLPDLVAELGARAPERRAEAYARLEAMGEKILPVLSGMKPADPEVRRQLRLLARSYRKVRLFLAARKMRLPLGEPLEMELRLVNETDERYRLPLTYTPQSGPTRSALVLEANGTTRPLPPDCVDVKDAAQRKEIILDPGAAAVVHIRLSGDTSPLRRPGSIGIAVHYRLVARRGDDDPLTEFVSLNLRSTRVEVEACGRSPHELEAALKGGRRQRASALRELEVREDKAILPLLRRQGYDPDLRLIAVKRLGALALIADLEFVRASTRSPSPGVRKAAVEALGHYGGNARARRRLLALADDSELQIPAIRALRGHKHPETITKFIRLLPNAGGEQLRAIQDLLSDWTGIWVEGRLSEIRAFERWWRTHRLEWTRRNSPAR